MLGVDAADSESAEKAGLIVLCADAMKFRHPLVRAAVYQGSTLSQRLAVHGALAKALRNPADASRRAWHLAAAATGPDPRVAAELEHTAVEAESRGGYAAAAAAYERAADLTADPAAQADRFASAAENRAEIGDFDQARSLAARASAEATDPIVQARLANVRARAEIARGQLLAAHRTLTDGAAKIAATDPPRTARMLTYAMHVAWLRGDRSLVADTATQLSGLGERASELMPLVELMLCLARQATGHPGDDPPRLADLVARARRSRAGDPYDLAMIAIDALVTGQNADASEMLTVLVADARAHGRIGWLPTLLACLAQAQLYAGRLCDATASATEALGIARATGQPQWASELNGTMAYLAAIEGNQERCHQLAASALAEPVGALAPAARPWVRWALGLLDLGSGRLDTALMQLEAIWQGAAHYHASALHSIPDLIEVMVRLGHPARAAEPLTRFSDWARLACSPGIDALAERCHALLEAGEEAEQHYLAALKLDDESFDRARTQLLYGAWLRRSRRKSDARTQLRAAAGYLDRIGAAPWAAQAHAELRATGVTSARPGRMSIPRLTPQELQVTRLAAQGLSNRDIAAQLFLSPRTVGYHLYKAYPKLGITSRGQLRPPISEP